jgi:exodeoxyribonuclease VII large subunit
VVRAAADSDIPLISAVGHETDWTLIDHASDRRAPTPTGAAEMAVPVKADLEAHLAGLAARLKSAQSRMLDRRREALRGLARALPTLDSVLALPRQRLDRSGQGLGQALQLNTANRRRSFERQAARITPIALVSAIREKRQLLRDRPCAQTGHWSAVWRCSGQAAGAPRSGSGSPSRGGSPKPKPTHA